MSTDHSPTQEPYELTEGLPIDKEDILPIANALQKLLRLETAALSARLAAGAAWLGMLEMFLRQAGAEFGIPKRDLIAKYIEMTEKGGFSEALRIGQAKGKRAACLQRMFLGTMSAFRNTPDKKRGGIGAFRLILWNYFKNAARIGRVTVAPLERSIPYEEFRSVVFTPDMEPVQSILQKFAKELTAADVLEKHRDLTRGYYLALTAIAICRWYAVGLADSGEVQSADLEKAVGLARDYYGPDSDLQKVLKSNPVMNSILYNVCRRKNFAHALVAWPV